MDVATLKFAVQVMHRIALILLIACFRALESIEWFGIRKKGSRNAYFYTERYCGLDYWCLDKITKVCNVYRLDYVAIKTHGGCYLVSAAMKIVQPLDAAWSLSLPTSLFFSLCHVPSQVCHGKELDVKVHSTHSDRYSFTRTFGLSRSKKETHFFLFWG